MNKYKIKKGDWVTILDTRSTEMGLLTVSVTDILESEDVYGSVTPDKFIGLSAAKEKRSGGERITFTEWEVLGVNGDARNTKYDCLRLLENSLRTGSTKFTVEQQMKLLGVLMIYAS